MTAKNVFIVTNPFLIPECGLIPADHENVRNNFFMNEFLHRRAGIAQLNRWPDWPRLAARRQIMQDQDDKEHGQAQAESEDEQVICSNELLAAIRERMRKQRQEEEEAGRNVSG